LTALLCVYSFPVDSCLSLPSAAITPETEKSIKNSGLFLTVMGTGGSPKKWHQHVVRAVLLCHHMVEDITWCVDGCESSGLPLSS
jgi:hypothetical protein